MKTTADMQAERDWWVHKLAVEKLDEIGITDLDERQAMYDLMTERPLSRWQREILLRLILTSRENREKTGGQGSVQ